MLLRQLQLKHFCNMLPNCMVLKIPAITKICCCVELTDTLNTWQRKFTMIITMLCNFEIFTSCQGLIWSFSKHYAKIFAGLDRNALSSIICSADLGILLFKILMISIMTFENFNLLKNGYSQIYDETPWKIPVKNFF